MEPIKDAFHRLLWFGHAAKERALPVWTAAVLRSEAAVQWLRLRPRVLWAICIGIALVLILGFLIGGGPSWYGKHHAALAPLLTLAAGVSVAAVALIRHFAQTDADRQRRITESFAKAVEQLGSDKLEMRLGGIYSLERISKESSDDYWTVIENLAAFVRERARRNEAERTSHELEQRISRRAYFLWQQAGQPDGRAEDFWTAAAREEEFVEPAADIAAVLTVLERRSEQNQKREGVNGWCFDLHGAVFERYNLIGVDLERANLRGARLEGTRLSSAHLESAILAEAHLEGARLSSAHLEGANLNSAHLEGADLTSAQLEGANLSDAHLEEAHLSGAHLEGANLISAHLERANLRGAHLEGAFLRFAHLEGAFLSGAHLEGARLTSAHLELAFLSDAHLEGADLMDAHLEGTYYLVGAHFDEGTNLRGANLEGANLMSATGLSEAQLRDAHGDAATKLPEGLARPAHWPVEVT